MDLRKLARGRDCMIRSPYCNFNPETVVLCHLPGGGMGAKRSDLLRASGCSHREHYVDNRVGKHAKAWERRMALLIGMERTIDQLVKEGIITW